ncbi:hypothetical protein PVAND_017474 [Polypedilum vanderplanki]|uniref:Sulfotransferase domain-containing protein n=1 Tax=Polypedilum vanderplanki TaxID=319348 RepID=A0A9J6BJ56_POLVA|nr:hypothetical protein PVAND_017474 [Polypedilum vanderplanki]
MSKNYEIIKTIRPKDENLHLDLLLSIKTTNEKFKDFPHLITYDFFLNGIDKLKDFELFEDDVLLCGYMRSGTTMMQEMIWLILNNFDFDRAKNVIRSERFPNFEGYDNRQKVSGITNYRKLEEFSRPRTFKTHCPIQFLPTQLYSVKPKIIYISRDVKDVVISMFYYLKDMFNETQMNFKEFLEKFMNDEILFTPYRQHLSGFKNLEYENILYLTYELVNKNIDEAIEKVGKFLEKKVFEENKEKLKKYLKFESMKNNTACNNEDCIKFSINLLEMLMKRRLKDISEKEKLVVIKVN